MIGPGAPDRPCFTIRGQFVICHAFMMFSSSSTTGTLPDSTTNVYSDHYRFSSIRGELRLWKSSGRGAPAAHPYEREDAFAGVGAGAVVTAWREHLMTGRAAPAAVDQAPPSCTRQGTALAIDAVASWPQATSSYGARL